MSGCLALAGVAGLLSARGFAQTEVGLRLDVDKRQVAVGDTLTVSIEFRQVGVNNTFTGSPSISTPEHFDIQGQSSATQVTIVNQQTAQISTTRYTLVATKPGDETIGPALLIYQDDRGKKHEIKSNVANVTVVEKHGFSLFGNSGGNAPAAPPQAAPPAPASPDELRGLKPLLPESFSFLKPMLLVLILGAIAGFVAWQFRKTPGASRAPAAPLGKAAQLREAWKKLSSEELGPKEFCLALSGLVRECLQYRFNFPAVDSTTEEILKALKQYKLTDDERLAAEKCLKACDRVVYADGNLTGRENLRALCSALLPKVPKA